MNTDTGLLVNYDALFPFPRRDKFPQAARGAAIATGASADLSLAIGF